MTSRSLHKVVASLALSCGLGACAIHPLPENMTGDNTVRIVRHIRCEARQAAVDTAIYYLQQHAKREGHEGKYDRVVDVYTLRRALATAKPTKRIDALLHTGIVYAFALQGTENNNAAFSADFVKPILHGTQSLNVAAGNIMVRDNIRAFTVSDNFMLYINDTDFDRRCLGEERGPYIEYPITGRIGVDEMVRTFISLAVTGDLTNLADPTKSPGTPAGAPAMCDTLTFTTTVSAGATPKIVLSPFGSKAQLMDASLALGASRVDKHQVIVGLGIPKQTPVPPVHGAVVSSVISAAPKARGSGEAIAAQAVAQQIIRFQLPTPLVGGVFAQ
jgi:hypothetical protein